MEDYRRLVEKVEGFFLKVREAYPDQLVCGEGCSECCNTSFKVFPMEAWALKQWWEDRIRPESTSLSFPSGMPSGQGGVKASVRGVCMFLSEDRCIVYPARPIICRTQGLPVLVRREKRNLEVRFCKKNFRQPSGTFTIKGEFLLDLDVLNVTLAVLDESFRRGWGQVSPQNLPKRVELSYFLRM